MNGLNAAYGRFFHVRENRDDEQLGSPYGNDYV